MHLGAFRAQALQRVFEPVGTCTRPRSAQDRAFQQSDRLTMRGFVSSKTAEWMLEQREQCHRLAAIQRGFRCEPRKNSGGRFRQRVAAGIVGRDFPAFQRRDHAARQCPIGRDQRGRAVCVVGYSFA